MSDPLLSEATATLPAASTSILDGLAAPTAGVFYQPPPLVVAWCSFLGTWCWSWFGTFTFHEVVHPERADKLWRHYVRKLNDGLYGMRWRKNNYAGLPWVRALEYQQRGAIHFHCLLGAGGVGVPGRWLAAEALWEELGGGIARVERIATQGLVAAYVAKYVTKAGEIELGGELGNVEWESMLIRLRARLL